MQTTIQSFIFWALLLLSSLPNALTAQITNQLTVQVRGFDAMRGKVRICLSQSKENFFTNCLQSKAVAVTDDVVSVSFQNLPAGKYAISLYHDEDGNGRLNRDGLFTLPSEKYGFSNNPRRILGPPKYELCLFSLQADLTIKIQL